MKRHSSRGSLGRCFPMAASADMELPPLDLRPARPASHKNSRHCISISEASECSSSEPSLQSVPDRLSSSVKRSGIRMRRLAVSNQDAPTCHINLNFGKFYTQSTHVERNITHTDIVIHRFRNLSELGIQSSDPNPNLGLGFCVRGVIRKGVKIWVPGSVQKEIAKFHVGVFFRFFGIKIVYWTFIRCKIIN